jgi:hypothetical protein
MFAFKDFVPRMIQGEGFFSEAEFESFESAVQAASQWARSKGVTVLNIETVVLPNIWDEDESGPRDPSLSASGKHHTQWHQFVRVWYHTSE